MPPPPRSNRRFNRTVLTVLSRSSLILAFLLTGCWSNWVNILRRGSEPCVLSPEISKTELIKHLNTNIAKLISWRSDDVTISTTSPQGLPIRLSASIAVESPKNFRLVAKSMLGSEADFGSNAKRFWFWMRRSQPKHIFTVSHDQFDSVQARLPIPFRPDWLMQALGVIPLDGSKLVMQPREPNSTMVSLVAKRTMPNGRRVHRVIVVDTCYGYIVQQSLREASGRTIASAEYNDYRIDKETGLRLPHKINLDWPQAKMTMTLKIGTIQVNPTNLSEKMWQMPVYKKYPVFDLGKNLHRLRRPRQSQPRFERPHSRPENRIGRVRIAPRSDNRSAELPLERPVFADEVNKFADEVNKGQISESAAATELPAAAATELSAENRLPRRLPNRREPNALRSSSPEKAKPFPGLMPD